MKKNKILVIVVGALLVVGIILGIVFIVGNPANSDIGSNKNSITEKKLSVGESLLKVETVSKLDSLLLENSLNKKEEFNWIYIDDIKLFDRSFSYAYTIDENEMVSNLLAKSVFSSIAEKKTQLTAAQLHEETNKIISQFIAFFGVEAENHYFIYDNSGNSLDILSDSSYDAILNNTAFLEFNVRESSMSYWKLSIRNSGSEVICYISHFINDDNYTDTLGDVNLDIQ